MEPIESEFSDFLLLTGENPRRHDVNSPTIGGRISYISKDKILMGRQVLVSCNDKHSSCIVQNLDNAGENRAKVKFGITFMCNEKKNQPKRRLTPYGRNCELEVNLMDEMILKVISEVDSKIYLYGG